MDKKLFKSQHHKLKPIWYGPCTNLQQLGENTFRLNLPSQLGIHDVMNVSQLKLYQPPNLEEKVVISHPKDTSPDFQPLLLKILFLMFAHTLLGITPTTT